MAFWSGETLKKRLPALVPDFDESLLDCNAYTLRMGQTYYCTSDGKRPIWTRAKKQELDPGQSFVIPAGQFAFLETRETIKVPHDAMAFISMKAKVKWEGLINISGFHVDPGYKGKLIFSAYNAGPSPIILEEGMALFLIWYASLDCENSQMVRKEDGGKTISKELIKGMSVEILSLQSLSKEIASLRLSMRVQAIIFGAAVTLFLGILLATMNFILERGFEEALQPNNATSAPPADANAAIINPAPAQTATPPTAPTDSAP